jgi:hypothetical protein
MKMPRRGLEQITLLHVGFKPTSLRNLLLDFSTETSTCLRFAVKLSPLLKDTICHMWEDNIKIYK